VAKLVEEQKDVAAEELAALQRQAALAEDAAERAGDDAEEAAAGVEQEPSANRETDTGLDDS
jgi:hypothetical protein